jgi:hypothetical protein
VVRQDITSRKATRSNCVKDPSSFETKTMRNAFTMTSVGMNTSPATYEGPPGKNKKYVQTGAVTTNSIIMPPRNFFSAEQYGCKNQPLNENMGILDMVRADSVSLN